MTSAPTERLSTGIDGLDEVLRGGFIPRRTYMVRGSPGTGKTLFGLQFLVAGSEAGEDVLFIALEEAESDLHENAAAVGIDTEDVSVLDLSPSSEFFVEDQVYEIFEPAEAEGRPLVNSITDRVENHDPDRVVLDPATLLRNLAPDDYQFRRQMLSFVRFLRERNATVIFTSQAAGTSSDEDLQFLTDGVVELRASDTDRSISVPKYRGSDTLSGTHSVRITGEGMEVYPELTPTRHRREFADETISSGVPGVDELLSGGIDRGTVTIISGPTGAGKTTLGTQFMKEAAGRGERSAMYLFEESIGTFLARSTAINIPVEDMRSRGTLALEDVEPVQLSASEFSRTVQEEVEDEGAEIVMIDGVDGYRMSLHGRENELTRKLHSLCRYLKNMGVTVILVDETGSVTGDFQPTSENISYLADTIVFIRYLEFRGELRKAIGVLKKRTGDFERTLREFEITQYGLEVGNPLSNLRGILKGTPDWVGDGGNVSGPSGDD